MRTGLPVALFVGAQIFVLIATVVTYVMVSMVNPKLREDEQFNYLFWYPGKMSKLKQRYRKLYPQGRLIFVFNMCTFMAIVLVVLCAWRTGFFQ